MLATTLLWLAWPVGAGETDPGAQLETVQQELQEVQKWLQNARQQQGSLMNTLRANEREIGKLGKAQRDSERKLARLRSEHRQSQSELKALQTKIDTQRAAIQRQLRARYIAGRGGQLRLLLNQQQPDQMARVSRYYDYLQKARLERIDAYLALLTEARTRERQINSQRIGLERANRQLAERQQSLAASRQARLLTLSKLNAGIQDGDDRTRKLQQDRAQLEELLEKVLATMPELALNRQETPFLEQRGQLQWPARGKLVNTFGRDSASSALHRNGLRIRAKAGAEVQAVHSGHVVFADWMRRFGLLIIIDHGNGYMSLYGHNESLLKQAGEWVAPGEPIAVIGNSGGQESSGLYFELRENGKPIDPRKWLSARR